MALPDRSRDATFDPDEHAGGAQAVAEKFGRTVSCLHALCHVRPVNEERFTDGTADSKALGEREPDAR